MVITYMNLQTWELPGNYLGIISANVSLESISNLSRGPIHHVTDSVVAQV